MSLINTSSDIVIDVNEIKSAQRRKLCDLSIHHCSILGTCLNLKEMVKIAKKINVFIPPKVNEYEIHSKFVHLAGASNKVSRYLEKYLDKKYQSQIKFCDTLTSEKELMEFWIKSMENGDVSSAYWTVLTHPYASDALINHVFGEVHMLSHQLGSSLRADIKKLGELEEKCRKLEETLSNTKKKYKCELSKKTKTLSNLEYELKKHNSLVIELEKARERIKLFKKSGSINQLSAGKEEYFKKYISEKNRADDSEQRVLELKKNLRSLQIAHEKLIDEHEEICEELDTQELYIKDLLKEHICAGDSCIEEKKCPCRKVFGKKLLYVGGRTSLVRFYRSLVEEKGGHLLHHDGGNEESYSRLEELLKQVDAVFCPIDCVSHGACLRVKDSCKRRGKPFLLLRSSGLSALAKGLFQLFP